MEVVGCGRCRSCPLLPPGSVEKRALRSPAHSCAMACWGQKTQSQEEEEEERLACHAALPSSPFMLLQVLPGSSLKSLSRGSCLASRVQESLCHHPKPAPAHCQGRHPPGPKSSPSCLAVLHPREAALPLQHQERLPYLADLALDVVRQSHWAV